MNYKLQEKCTGEDDDDGSDPVGVLLTPVEALTSVRQLDRYLRIHDNSEEMLHFLAKLKHHVVHTSVLKQ